MSTARNESPTEGVTHPCDRDRDGFVMGEGAAHFGSRKFGTRQGTGGSGCVPRSWVAGSQVTLDTITCSRTTKNRVRRRARAYTRGHSSARGGVATVEDVDSINAHGTSTPLGDVAEVRAIRNSSVTTRSHQFQLCSTKSMIGHTLGAAEGWRRSSSVLSCRDGVVPPTINCDNPDEEFAGWTLPSHRP